MISEISNRISSHSDSLVKRLSARAMVYTPVYITPFYYLSWLWRWKILIQLDISYSSWSIVYPVNEYSYVSIGT